MMKMVKYAGYAGLVVGTLAAVILAQDATAIDAVPKPADAGAARKPVVVKPKPAPAPVAAPAPAAAVKKPAEEAKQPGAEPAAQSAQTPAPEPQQQEAQTPIYTQHALHAGVRNCAPIVNHLGNIAADTDYAVQSVWNREEPNAHMFWQLMGLNYSKRPGLSKASSILVASPTGEMSCEGVLVQVIPSPRSCEAIEESLGKEGGKALDGLVGVRNVLSVRGERVMLLPSQRSCVIVSVMGAQSQPRSQ